MDATGENEAGKGIRNVGDMAMLSGWSENI